MQGRKGERGGGAGEQSSRQLAENLTHSVPRAAVRAQTQSQQHLQEHGSASGSLMPHLALWPALPAEKLEGCFSLIQYSTDRANLVRDVSLVVLMVQIWLFGLWVHVCLHPSIYNVLDLNTERLVGQRKNTFPHFPVVTSSCTHSFGFICQGFEVSVIRFVLSSQCSTWRVNEISCALKAMKTYIKKITRNISFQWHCPSYSGKFT